MTSYKTDYLPNALSPHTITLGVGLQHMHLQGRRGTNLQSITCPVLKEFIVFGHR